MKSDYARFPYASGTNASRGTKRKGNRGQILAENTIFISLNLIFLTILVLFVVSRTGTDASVEEKYAKQIALMIDAAESGMVIRLNMEDLIKRGGENNWNKIVSIKGNNVTVKLREKGGFTYSFFNDVEVTADKTLDEKEYAFKINPRIK